MTYEAVPCPRRTGQSDRKFKVSTNGINSILNEMIYLLKGLASVAKCRGENILFHGL
jgi:hypothetical protein